MFLNHLPPVTNCHTFSDPLPPLERDVLYGRPRVMSAVEDCQLISFAIFVKLKQCHCRLNVKVLNSHFSCLTPRAT